ncbi:MAG: SCO family protein [Candidatus Pseudobacter hemicellulosilyticus]|uniref:SCO family protein n=1 Tax=Candidatus Pseudobacter hemicellulosilyticus TaxID=3121375 RepID=A0AAJ5WUL4_9BACT|nr:MAG: SCO family protein [Pseudobacter sp.]
MKRKYWFYIGFFLFLVIGFYVALNLVIPGYGKVKLPVLSYVKPFHFVNQDGKPVTEREVEGKVYVVEYFFTTCQSICPIMNKNLLPIHEAYKQEPRFLILSHTCQPETDSVARLKVYADSLKADTRSWWFLTGPKDSLYGAARNSYLLDDPKNNAQNIEEQFLHTQFFALVDKGGRVRKIYDGLKKDELESLKKDIGSLLEEHVEQTRFSNNIFGN